jgi:thiol-disulfide isomerase/thioredoxin
MSNKTRYALLAAILIIIVATIVYTESGRISTSTINQEASIENVDESVEKDMMYEKAKEIVRPAGYVNSDPIKIEDYIGGKVILLDFMTYSCINCQRTYPYLNAWWEKYKDKGLQIIGIHTPEFDFEKNINNVMKAAQQFGLKFPLVLDNDYGTWRAYGNRYWPRKYLIDIDGYIVYDHIGEGAYQEAESKIKELLLERAEKLGEEVDIDNSFANPEAVVADKSGPLSPETYFGSLRNNLKKVEEVPANPVLNQLYLVGDWNIEEEYAEALTTESKVIFKYRASVVYFVASADSDVEVTVLRDGKEINQITVNNETLYTLIENPEGYGEYILEFSGNKSGLKVYTFTFG